jgi:hypothetical protein
MQLDFSGLLMKKKKFKNKKLGIITPLENQK